MPYHDRNELVINSLQKGLQPLVRYIMYILSRRGESVLLVEGFRNEEKQTKEYLEGDSFVLFPYSFHNNGVAIDFVPVRFGIPWHLEWGASKRYKRIARVFQQHGFEWGFALWGFDKGHVQFSKVADIREYINGYYVKGYKYKEELEALLDMESKKLEKGLEKALAAKNVRREKKILDEIGFFVRTRDRILAT